MKIKILLTVALVIVGIIEILITSKYSKVNSISTSLVVSYLQIPLLLIQVLFGILYIIYNNKIFILVEILAFVIISFFMFDYLFK